MIEDDTGVNRLCFSGRSVPEISLINEDLPQKSTSFNGSLNGLSSHHENGRISFPLHSSPPPTSYNMPFVPFHPSTSQRESPASSKFDNLQLDLATLCRKNDDMLKLIREQQIMIRDLKQTVLGVERTVNGMQDSATPDRAIQETIRIVQGIPREREIRSIVQEIMKEETEVIAKMLRNAVASSVKTTCDKEVQASPQVQDFAAQSQVVAYEREYEGNQIGQEEVRNHRGQRVARNGAETHAVEIRHAERRPIPYPQPPLNSHNETIRQRFADLCEVRECLPEIEGQPADNYPNAHRPEMLSRSSRRFAPTRDNENYQQRTPNGGVASTDAYHPPAFTSAAEAYHPPALPARGRYSNMTGKERLVDNEELDYYPERGSPGPREYAGYEIRGKPAPGRFSNSNRMQRLRNDLATRNPERENHYIQRGEESLIANQFVAKYLGAERLNKLQRPPPQQPAPTAPPRPPPHRRTIVTGNVSFAQFAVQTQYPSPGGHPVGRHDASPYAGAGHDGRYGLADDEDDEQYDSWDDEPQGEPVPPSQRILDLTAIYNQPAAQ